MLKSFCAVLIGYVVMVAVAMPIFGLAYIAPDFVFEEDQATATLAFSICTLIVGFVAALLGGLVAAKIAGGSARAVTGLAGLVLALGLCMFLVNRFGERPPEKTAEEIRRMSVEERARNSREPPWYSVSMPLVGAIGVLVGGNKRRRRLRADASGVLAGRS